jgi:hypothetical protein
MAMAVFAREGRYGIEVAVAAAGIRLLLTSAVVLGAAGEASSAQLTAASVDHSNGVATPGLSADWAPRAW